MPASRPLPKFAVRVDTGQRSDYGLDTPDSQSRPVPPKTGVGATAADPPRDSHSQLRPAPKFGRRVDANVAAILPDSQHRPLPKYLSSGNAASTDSDSQPDPTYGQSSSADSPDIHGRPLPRHGSRFTPDDTADISSSHTRPLPKYGPRVDYSRPAESAVPENSSRPTPRYGRGPPAHSTPVDDHSRPLPKYGPRPDPGQAATTTTGPSAKSGPRPKDRQPGTDDPDNHARQRPAPRNGYLSRPRAPYDDDPVVASPRGGARVDNARGQGITSRSVPPDRYDMHLNRPSTDYAALRPPEGQVRTDRQPARNNTGLRTTNQPARAPGDYAARRAKRDAKQPVNDSSGRPKLTEASPRGRPVPKYGPRNENAGSLHGGRRDARGEDARKRKEAGTEGTGRTARPESSDDRLREERPDRKGGSLRRRPVHCDTSGPKEKAGPAVRRPAQQRNNNEPARGKRNEPARRNHDEPAREKYHETAERNYNVPIRGKYHDPTDFGRPARKKGSGPETKQAWTYDQRMTSEGKNRGGAARTNNRSRTRDKAGEPTVDRKTLPVKDTKASTGGDGKKTTLANSLSSRTGDSAPGRQPPAKDRTFSKHDYTDIDTSPRRRDGHRHPEVGLATSRRYNQVSCRYNKRDFHTKVIKIHRPGNNLAAPRHVLLPPPKVNTLADVLFFVDQIMCDLCKDRVVRLYDVEGNKILGLDQIMNNCHYVACCKTEQFTPALYPEHGASNFSNSKDSHSKYASPVPRSNKTSSQSSPDHSHNGSENSYMQRSRDMPHRREKMRRETDGVFNGRAVQYKRSSQRRDVDYEQENGPYRSRDQNPYTRDARPVEDSNQTRTERPIDDRPAETVQDEEEFDGYYDNEADPWAGGDYQEEHINGKKSKKGKKEDASFLPPINDRTQRSNARTSNSPGNEQAHKDAAARRQAEDLARAEKTQRDREAAEQRRREKEEQKKREQEEKRKEREREQEERKREKEREQEERKRERKAERKEDRKEERKAERKEDRKEERKAERKEDRKAERKQDKAAKGKDKKDSKAAKDKSPTGSSEEEEAAATKIQAGYRGYRTRKGLKQKRKEEEVGYGRQDSSLLQEEPIPLDGDDDWGSDTNHQNVREDEAATKIQAAFRGHQARREVKERRNNHEVKEEKEERNSPSQPSPQPASTQQSDSEAEHTAASKIQASFRGHQTRKQLAAEAEAENKAASKIQASFRGHQTRKQLAAETEANAEIEAENKAASKIQASFRGHQTRKQLAAESESENKAASKIQATFRGHQTRKQLAANSEAAAVDETEAENAAASKIQATFRGHQTRKQLAAEAEAENAAASKIQATFRGHQTRKQLAAETEAENEAASKIQATFRGHQTRKQLAASKDAREEDPAMEDTEHSSNTQSN